MCENLKKKVKIQKKNYFFFFLGGGGGRVGGVRVDGNGELKLLWKFKKKKNFLGGGVGGGGGGGGGSGVGGRRVWGSGWT